MTTDIDLNKLISELPKEDKITIACLSSLSSEWGHIIDDLALESKVYDSVAVENLKKSVAAITGTLVSWFINRGKDETKKES